MNNSKNYSFGHIVEILLYKSRWMLSLMYIGLTVAMGAYTLRFFIELLHACVHFSSMTEEDLLINTLGLVDITMIANLIYVIMLGGYSIFVREIQTDVLKDKPKWLNNINSGTLKIKMGVSLIGVSSIHLLKVFINSSHWDWSDLGKMMSIHGLFIVSTIALAWVDTHSLHPASDNKEH